MRFARTALLFALLVTSLLGCGGEKTVIPTAEFTEEQKKAIQADDAKIADEESHGAKKRLSPCGLGTDASQENIHENSAEHLVYGGRHLSVRMRERFGRQRRFARAAAAGLRRPCC